MEKIGGEEGTAEEVERELRRRSDKKRAESSLWFFKTGKGEYGEGDKFLGVKCDDMRKIAKRFSALPLSEIHKLLQNPFHDCRQTALFILVRRFQRGEDKEREKIYNFYLARTKRINNWDLVDCSAHKIIGEFLFDKNRSILYKLAKSRNLWDRRISAIATFYFIQRGESKDALNIAELLLDDREDLIHKAVGWMLREVGNRCSIVAEEKFLKKFYKKMPRTMLRYAIEKFPNWQRKKYLRGEA